MVPAQHSAKHKRRMFTKSSSVHGFNNERAYTAEGARESGISVFHVTCDIAGQGLPFTNFFKNECLVRIIRF